MLKDEKLTSQIIACAHKVHNTLGSGFLEKVYENAMMIELAKSGLKVEQQARISVIYEGQPVGDYYADLFVENAIIVECKALVAIVREHEVQLVNYLVATGIDTGLLINFGPSVAVRRKFREYRKSKAIGQD